AHPLMRIIILLVTVMLISACASRGRPIPQSNIDQIVQGETTRSELVEMFGPPLSETVNSDGTTVLGWGYAYIGFAGIGTETQGLSVVISPDDKVVSYTK